MVHAWSVCVCKPKTWLVSGKVPLLVGKRVNGHPLVVCSSLKTSQYILGFSQIVEFSNSPILAFSDSRTYHFRGFHLSVCVCASIWQVWRQPKLARLSWWSKCPVAWQWLVQGHDVSTAQGFVRGVDRLLEAMKQKSLKQSLKWSTQNWEPVPPEMVEITANLRGCPQEIMAGPREVCRFGL